MTGRSLWYHGKMILILEDDADRRARFQACLRGLDPPADWRIWVSAWDMIRDLPEVLPSAALISLDHDLFPLDEGSDPDPGDGMDVARHLAQLPAVCPVVIHSSNSQRALWMAGEFELGGWKVRRVAPLGDDWVEADWFTLVRRLIRRRP